MPQVYELGLFINPSVDKRVKNFITNAKIPGLYQDSIPFASPIGDLPNKLLVAGGEGSIRTVTREIYRRRQIRPVGLLAGGSNNVLFQYLVDTGREVSLREFLDTAPDKFDPKFYFRPGMAKDGKGEAEEFNNLMGVGRYEILSGQMNELFRRVPRKVRPFTSRTLTWLLTRITDDDILDIYSDSPNIGRVHAFRDQDLFGSDITHAWIEGDKVDQVRKLTATLILWQFHLRPPKTILRTSRGVIYGVNMEPNSAWFDGDVEKHRLRGGVMIGRVSPELEIPVMAIRK